MPRLWYVSIKPRTHEAFKSMLFAQILDPYEATPDEFAQIKVVLFAHVNIALGYGSLMPAS